MLPIVVQSLVDESYNSALFIAKINYREYFVWNKKKICF